MDQSRSRRRPAFLAEMQRKRQRFRSRQLPRRRLSTAAGRSPRRSAAVVTLSAPTGRVPTPSHRRFDCWGKNIPCPISKRRSARVLSSGMRAKKCLPSPSRGRRSRRYSPISPRCKGSSARSQVTYAHPARAVRRPDGGIGKTILRTARYNAHRPIPRELLTLSVRRSCILLNRPDKIPSSRTSIRSESF